MVSRLVTRGIDSVTLVALGRLLSPADFGLVAIAMSVMLIAEAVMELPVGLALTSMPRRLNEHYDTAFTLQLIRSGILVAVLVVLSIPLSMIYNDQRVGWLLCALSVAPATRGMYSPLIVEYALKLDYRPHLFLEISGKLVALLVSVVSAWWSRSYWAIAAGMIANPVTVVAMTYFVAPYLPTLTVSKWRDFSNYLRWSTATQAITSFIASYRRNDSLVVAAPFRSLNLNAESEIIGFTLRQPIYRTLTDEFAVAITGEHLSNKVTSVFDTAGLPSLFIPGSSSTGVSTVSALRFIQEYVHRTSTSVIAARSRFSVGLDVLNATNNSGPLPDGQFFSWLGQVQAVRRFDDWWGMQLLGQMSLQLANDRLFPLEQIPVGGRYSVRGYRENTLIRDNAFLASVETRYPVIKFASGEDLLQFTQFVDLGRAWDAKGATPDPQTLASVGLGLRWNIFPNERARFEVYWGAPLNFNNVHRPQGDSRDHLQDNGVHMQLIVQVL